MSDKLPKMLQPLPEKKWLEAREYLIEGHKPPTVAKVIQSDWGLLKKVKRASLVRTLRRYLDDHITEVEILQYHGASDTLTKAAERMDGMINALDEYQELVRMSMARARAGFALEVGVGKMSKSTTELIDTANRVLTSYSNVALRAGLIQKLTVEEAEDALKGVIVGEVANAVLTQPDLKKGLVHLLGHMIEEVKSVDDIPIQS